MYRLLIEKQHTIESKRLALLRNARVGSRRKLGLICALDCEADENQRSRSFDMTEVVQNAYKKKQMDISLCYMPVYQRLLFK